MTWQGDCLFFFPGNVETLIRITIKQMVSTWYYSIQRVLNRTLSVNERYMTPRVIVTPDSKFLHKFYM